MKLIYITKGNLLGWLTGFGLVAAAAEEVALDGCTHKQGVNTDRKAAPPPQLTHPENSLTDLPGDIS